MRTFGFLVALIGGLIIYLGFTGKVSPFFSALITGKYQANGGSAQNSNSQGTISSAGQQLINQNASTSIANALSGTY